MTGGCRPEAAVREWPPSGSEISRLPSLCYDGRSGEATRREGSLRTITANQSLTARGAPGYSSRWMLSVMSRTANTC
jgi:hypothetical protein